jgi:cold-inducible RNA-binding protein
MAKKLYVGNLSFNVTQAQIQALFAEAGEVTEVNLINDRHTGSPKGFGFVEMATEEGAQEAIKRFNGYSLDDRDLTVNEARPREPQSGSFSGGQRDSNSDRRNRS